MSWGHRRTSDHEVAGVVTPSRPRRPEDVNAAPTAPSMASLGGRWRTWIGFVARRYGPAEEGGASAFWPCSSRDPVGFLGATVVDGSVVVVGGWVVVVGDSVVVVVSWVVVAAPSVVVDGEPAGTGPGAAVEVGDAVVLRLGGTC